MIGTNTNEVVIDSLTNDTLTEEANFWLGASEIPSLYTKWLFASMYKIPHLSANGGLKK